MLKSISLAASLLVLLSTTSGCAVTRVSTAVGKEFEMERLLQLKAGMTKDEVKAAMGDPYATGVDLEGTEFYDYQYSVTSNTGVAAGIVVLQGYVGGTSTRGAMTHVLFQPGTGTVTTVQYEIAGQENYEKFVMGKDTK